MRFARSTGYEIIESYYDAAVSGADAVTARPGFSAMLERLLANGVRTILVETASRFARDLIVLDWLRDAEVAWDRADRCRQPR
ncbi:recombinase family protein [Mesorhizobium sp. NZP2077]|uniref:recombinase family protein n=1 Tax=Mesorhizobium sp. NZP2077 TaxID=2483404 RepID=UPI001AEEE478|nr:recombinase family protein [Mesorhizobium sp. NZP2077]